MTYTEEQQGQIDALESLAKDCEGLVLFHKKEAARYTEGAYAAWWRLRDLKQSFDKENEAQDGEN